MSSIREIKPAEVKEKYPVMYDILFVQPWGQAPIKAKVEQPLSVWEATRLRFKEVKERGTTD